MQYCFCTLPNVILRLYTKLVKKIPKDDERQVLKEAKEYKKS